MYTLIILVAFNCAQCGSAGVTIPGFTSQQSCNDAALAMREEITESTRRLSGRGAIVRCVKVD